MLFENNGFSLAFLVEGLNKAGYKIKGFNINYNTKTIQLGITGSDKYYQDNKAKLKEKAEAILHAKGMDAYKVEVGHVNAYSKPKGETLTKKQKQYINKSKNLEGAIITELKKQGYGIISADVRINSKEKFIPLEILVTEKRVKEIKGVVQQILKEKHLSNFTIKFYRIDPVKEEADKRWRPVIDAITTGLAWRKRL